MSYNIHHSEGMDGVLDLSRYAEIIAAQKPDNIALQEDTIRTHRRRYRLLPPVHGCFSSSASIRSEPSPGRLCTWRFPFFISKG